MNKDFSRGRRMVPLVLLSMLFLTAFVPRRASTGKTSRVYVGTYTEHGSRGIYRCDFNSETGVLGQPQLAVESEAPSFLAIAPSEKFLYTVNELVKFKKQPTGTVSSFSIDRATGDLTPLNQISSRGPGPTHIILDRSGRYILIANYDGGSVAVFPLLPDGKIGESTAFVQHKGSSVNRERQEGPHAHAIAMSPDNRFAIVADLGLDQLLVYPFDQTPGALGQPHIVTTEPGAGPRHLSFDRAGKHLYLVNELQSTITVYSYDSHDGGMTPLQTISSLPFNFAGTSTAAEIVLSPSGKFVYVSNRGDDSIATFAVNPEKATLTLVEHVKCGGKRPRNFAIDPSGEWLLVANQDSDNIVVFRVDRKSGRLTPAGQSIEIHTPVMVDFVSISGGKRSQGHPAR